MESPQTPQTVQFADWTTRRDSPHCLYLQRSRFPSQTFCRVQGRYFGSIHGPLCQTRRRFQSLLCHSRHGPKWRTRSHGGPGIPRTRRSRRFQSVHHQFPKCHCARTTWESWGDGAPRRVNILVQWRTDACQEVNGSIIVIICKAQSTRIKTVQYNSRERNFNGRTTFVVWCMTWFRVWVSIDFDDHTTVAEAFFSLCVVAVSKKSSFIVRAIDPRPFSQEIESKDSRRRHKVQDGLFLLYYTLFEFLVAPLCAMNKNWFYTSTSWQQLNRASSLLLASFSSLSCWYLCM